MSTDTDDRPIGAILHDLNEQARREAEGPAAPRPKKARTPKRAELSPREALGCRVIAIHAALHARARDRFAARWRVGCTRMQLPPEWGWKEAEWGARHIDPAFHADQVARGLLDRYSDRRFLALLVPVPVPLEGP